MIHLHAIKKALWAIPRFADEWAPELAPAVATTSYEELTTAALIAPGVHIFSDFERLLPQERALARRLHRRLAARPESFRILNDPSKWLSRFELLRALAEAGLNDFQVHRLSAADSRTRFPAFLRWEHEHSGSIGDAVGSGAALRLRAESVLGGRRTLLRRMLMVVEQLDVRDNDGLCRKYSAMKIGDRLIPRHVLFSNDWVTKKADVVTPELAAEEQRFLDTFPHAEQVAHAFSIAGMDYGRIDYGFHDGRLQVWEINSNPVLVPLVGQIDPLRLPAQRRSAEWVADGLRALLVDPLNGPGTRPFVGPERLFWRAQLPITRRYDKYRADRR